MDLFYLNCVYFELMYLFKSCIYNFLIPIFIIFDYLNCFYVFIHYYLETCLLLYPFYDIHI